MSDKTGIEWTDATWPVVNGCRRKSAGCEHCYAERLIATRLRHQPKYAGLAEMTPSGPRWTGVTRLDEATLMWPLRWKRPRRIFVANMGDLFADGVPDADIDRVFAVMALASRHTFQVLTKRPERMRAYLTGHALVSRIMRAAQETPKLPHQYDPNWPGWPLPNVWLGVSVEDQPTADARIPELLATPAAVRFVSYEPALGPVNFLGHIMAPEKAPDCVCGHGHSFGRCPNYGGVSPTCHRRGCACDGFRRPLGVTLDQIIVGGESGPGARPCDVAWIRSTRDQCRAAGVACFVKQFGAKPVTRWTNGDLCEALRLRDRKGGDPAEWPEDLRVREFPALYERETWCVTCLWRLDA